MGQIKKTQSISDIQLEKLEPENKKEFTLKKITDLFCICAFCKKYIILKIKTII